jgi:4-amino-4-deoxy-L-arabinose transferase-like glycosyltransferase
MARQRLLQALLIIAALATLITPWRRDLFVGDETKYSQVIREMRATGHFFLPTLGGVPFTHKPPLHFWAIDLLTFPFGTYSIWPFVLPSLVAFVFLLWLMGRMGGPLAAFVCATSFMIWGSAQTARMDVGFTAFIALGAWMLFRFFEADDVRTRTSALLGGGVAIGIATLIKGPMAPVIAILLFALETWRRRRVPRGNYLPALAAMIVIPLLWVVPAVMIGGRTYAHEILVKQTLGRAVSTWVHKAPPWFYLAHMPGILLPWFFVALIALVARWRGTEWDRLCVNWILAVVVPYSLMSSKLDVYMMAMIPPAASIIGDFVTDDGVWQRRAHVVNLVTLAMASLVGIVAAFVVTPSRIAAPEGALVNTPAVKSFFIFIFMTFLVAFVVSLGLRTLFASTVAIGTAMLLLLIFAAAVLTPLANRLGSTQPLIAALERQRDVPPEGMALYACPNLWSQFDFPRELERVHYVGAEELAAMHPALIATSRIHAPEIAASLRGWRKVGECRMIGKWFDVYRR